MCVMAKGLLETSEAVRSWNNKPGWLVTWRET